MARSSKFNPYEFIFTAAERLLIIAAFYYVANKADRDEIETVFFIITLGLVTAYGMWIGSFMLDDVRLANKEILKNNKGKAWATLRTQRDVEYILSVIIGLCVGTIMIVGMTVINSLAHYH